MHKFQQIKSKGAFVDVPKTTLFQQISHQRFVRDDVLISQSIDPYKQIQKANKIILLGESLFLNEKSLTDNNK